MGDGKEALSHEEVWDDSALIDSWNEALDEYKKYHSIHAKGGSLEDLEAAATSRMKQPPVPNTDNASAAREDLAPSDGQQTPSTKSHGIGHVPPGPPPQALLGTVRDENLKKLLMAWYYAGYYTGLFEGQQQAQQDEKPQSSQG